MIKKILKFFEAFGTIIQNRFFIRFKNKYIQTFLIALITATAFFLPYIIVDKGIFIYFGDFDVQQIPFYQLVHRAVKSGNMSFSFTTDLGANFIGGYSFSLLGSIFFWLTIPFKTEFVPYLMAPLLILKFALIAVTGFAFIKRFVKNQQFAMLGGLLYSFCGFNVYNIFFNNFHDSVLLFPLILIALEELVLNNRRGMFTISIALSALCNYFFFFGQLVFLLIYLLVRCYYTKFRITPKKLLLLVLEGLLGLLISMIIFLPAVLAIIDNPRISGMLTGYSIFFYYEVQRYGQIIQSLFMPADIPAIPNLFKDSNAKWASVSAFLPLFGLVGVISYFRAKQKDFFKTILIICGVMAFIPILNSLFFALNESYYARWFYMPILIMALVTVKALEEKEISFSFGLKFSLIVIIGFSLFGFVPSSSNGSLEWFSLVPNKLRFWATILIALVGIIQLFLMLKFFERDKRFANLAIFSLCIITVLYACFTISTGKKYEYGYEAIVTKGIEGGQKINLPKNEFYRIDTLNLVDNYPMLWNMPGIQAFHSIVPGSIMDFYKQLDIKRDVGSRPPDNYVALRSLLSVKYAFAPLTTQNYMAGFKFHSIQNGFRVFENENFIPMGFSYDYYVDKSVFEQCPQSNRDNLMLKGVYLSFDQIYFLGKYLKPLPNDQLSDFSNYSLIKTTKQRASQSVISFNQNKNGFSSTTNYKQNRLVFFSVPFDKGFSATIDGKSVKIEKVNVGFMAVLVPKGSHIINFTYKTPGLDKGIVFTFLGILLFIFYIYSSNKSEKRKARFINRKTHLIDIQNNSDIKAKNSYIEQITNTIKNNNSK